MSEEKSSSSSTPRECVLVNFRPSAGLKERVYRCGATDALAKVVDSPQDLTEDERIFLYEITLNVDLRGSKEVNQEILRAWTSRAPGGPFEVVEGPVQDVTNSFSSRVVFRNNLIERCFPVIDSKWLSDVDPKDLEDFNRAMALRMKALKQRGLAELFEVILEANKEEGMASAMQVITMNLEKDRANKAVINCSQGKDRTGIVTMLLQSAIGLSDEDIIADFAKSEESEMSKEGSAAMEAAEANMKIDREALAGSKPEVMEATLAFLREKYGSVSPGYLDEIGFDESWRNRLLAALD